MIGGSPIYHNMHEVAALVPQAEYCGCCTYVSDISLQGYIIHRYIYVLNSLIFYR